MSLGSLPTLRTQTEWNGAAATEQPAQPALRPLTFGRFSSDEPNGVGERPDEGPVDADWEPRDPSDADDLATEPLPPLTFARLSSAPDHAPDHVVDADPQTRVVPDVSSDGSPNEEPMVEATSARLETFEVPALPETETADSDDASDHMPIATMNGNGFNRSVEEVAAEVSDVMLEPEEARAEAECEVDDAGDQPDEATAEPRGFVPLSAPESNGAGDYDRDEPPMVAVTSFDLDRSVGVQRSSTSHRVAFACLAALIGVLLLVTGRGVRRFL